MNTAFSANVRASRYRIWIDPRAEVTRKQMRAACPRDIASGTLRLALHLSDAEHTYLCRMNPALDGDDADGEWAKFISHPDSKPYRVNRV